MCMDTAEMGIVYDFFTSRASSMDGCIDKLAFEEVTFFSCDQ